jgi:hypothetical protein
MAQLGDQTLAKVTQKLAINLFLPFKTNTKEGFEDPQRSEKITFVVLNWKLGNKLMRLKVENWRKQGIACVHGC